MRIHRVRPPGETLSQIAAEHGTSVNELVHLNEWPAEIRLVPGVNVLVPGPPMTLRNHIVRSGDTLFALSRRYGTPEREIRIANGLTSDVLLPGQGLLIPVLVRQKKQVEVNAYLIPTGTEQDRQTVAMVSSRLTYMTVFSYHARPDGGLVPLPDGPAIDEAKAHRVAPILAVSNFDGRNFNPDVARAILTSPARRSRLITEVENVLREKRYHGVNIDFEHMYPADRYRYNEFLRELKSQMQRRGYPVSVALGPKTSDEPGAAWMGAFDYPAIGEIVDFLMLMTYEWGWVGGPPMAIAPLHQVSAVLRYATSVIPPRKILMGIPLYGYDWELPDTPQNFAVTVSPQQAIMLAVQHQAAIRWDPLAASPTFRYTAADGKQHEVWFEDAASVMVKFHLVYSLALRGMSYWVLGHSFPQNWHLVRDTFLVTKI